MNLFFFVGGGGGGAGGDPEAFCHRKFKIGPSERPFPAFGKFISLQNN